MRLGICKYLRKTKTNWKCIKTHWLRWYSGSTAAPIPIFIGKWMMWGYICFRFVVITVCFVFFPFFLLLLWIEMNDDEITSWVSDFKVVWVGLFFVLCMDAIPCILYTIPLNYFLISRKWLKCDEIFLQSKQKNNGNVNEDFGSNKYGPIRTHTRRADAWFTQNIPWFGTDEPKWFKFLIVTSSFPILICFIN